MRANAPILMTMLALLVAATPDPSLFGADGYRIARYRSPVPVPPEGVAQLTPAQLARLVDAGRALLIDVGPAEGGRRDPATGQWTLATPHLTIPGAHWFPEAGRSPAHPAIAAGFDGGVAALVAANRNRRLVVFCLSDCWMSWNAALRLHRQGYRVSWSAEGSDGWAALGRPLAEASPHGSKEK